jgi:hypothetical protein
MRASVETLLSTVMKDLSHVGKESDDMLSPHPKSSAGSTLSGFDTPLLRWEAFSKLVRSVLLPMADVGVVHADIRLDPMEWSLCNMIVDERAHPSGEFRLIDLESLVVFRYARSRGVSQEYAISINHFGDSSSAHEFVFWQILWVAYVWCPMTSSDNLRTSWGFVYSFLKSDDEQFREFRNWIQGNFPDGVTRLQINQKLAKEDCVIEDTLEIFRTMFQ